MKTIVKGLIGMEDLFQGIGSFSRSTSTGGTQALSKVPLAVDSAGGLSVSTLNRVLYVGENFATLWGSSDIGAQINAAYAALPTYGGEIRIAQKVDGTPYAYTTPIVLSTSGKYVRLVGEGVGGQDGGLAAANSAGGVCLNYTPTTATAAITVDYVPSVGGGFSVNHGLFNIDFIGGAVADLQSGGPASSSNIGLQIGASHSGMQTGTLKNVRFLGFSIGEQFSTGVIQSWGVSHYNCTFAACTKGVNVHDSGIESIRYFDCQFTFNGRGITSSSNAFGNCDFFYFGCSFDTNTTWSVDTTGGGIHDFHGCHFENLGGTTVHFIQSDGRVALHGGFMLDDVATSSTDKWINILTGGTCHVFGTTIFSAGRTSTTFIAGTTGVNTRFDGTLLSATFTNSVTGGTTVADTGVASPTQNYFASLNSKRLGMHNATALQTTDFAFSGWGSGATITAVAGTDQGYKLTITAGGSPSSNPTITHTYKDGNFPAVPVYLAQIIGGTGIADTGMSILTPVSLVGSTLWTAGGTPTNGHTYVYNVIGLGN